PQPGEAATDGGYYTQEDIKEIVKYASDRFITIVPEIDIPGHSMGFIASYPQASCDGKQHLVYAGTAGGAGDNVLCAGNEENFTMLSNIFGEIASLFPGEFIHIGGDEVDKSFWKGCPKCQKVMTDNGLKNEHELQSYFIKRVEKIVESKGKKIIGWDEILQGGLAPNAAVMSWQGMEGGIAAAKAGHYVVMTPTSHCYLDYQQGEAAIEGLGGGARISNTYKFEPVPEGVDAKYILGGQGNVWTEFIANERRVEYMTWPRALALSEVYWSPKSKRDWNSFVPRMEAQFERFKNTGVNYAPSVYDPDIYPVKNQDGSIQIGFRTEMTGLDIYYTFDFSFPDNFSAKYDGNPIKAPMGASVICAITYRNGKPVGRLLRINLDDLYKR
ncbi:MAG: family 20 glycosylhydrolase, partial [Bacteroidota bacterium]|nr:family 20 glycosylhydrolase [Bacteroidota bacterium]